MRVAVTGATGFLGRPLVRRLSDAKHEVTAFSRSVELARKVLPPGVRILPWKPEDLGELAGAVAGLDAVINLAGENIGAGRWDESRRQAILNSRVHAGKSLALAFTQIKKKPKVFIQTSAVGIYGEGGDVGLDENAPAGKGFLSRVVQAWEESVRDVSGPGVRLVILRLGMVLGPDGGALPRMVRPFKAYLGGVPGTGKAWVSWVHREDAVSAFFWALGNRAASGTFNVCAPAPVRSDAFYHLLGKVLRRPCALPLPAWLLSLAFGEMADELLLRGQRVLPDKIRRAGFTFAFLEAESALRDILGKGGGPS
jgi:hypothetical protein